MSVDGARPAPTSAETSKQGAKPSHRALPALGRCLRSSRVRRASLVLVLGAVTLVPALSEIHGAISGTAALEAEVPTPLPPGTRVTAAPPGADADSTTLPGDVSNSLFMRLEPRIELWLPRRGEPDPALASEGLEQTPLLLLDTAAELRLNLRWGTMQPTQYRATLEYAPWHALTLSLGVAPPAREALARHMTLPRLIIPVEPAAMLRGDTTASPEAPYAALRVDAVNGDIGWLPSWLPVDMSMVLYPWSPRPAPPSSSSPWFSDRGIPETQEWVFYDRTRAEIVVTEESFGPDGEPDSAGDHAGYTAALGLEYPLIEVRAGSFAGWNPDLLLSGEMMVRLEDSRSFRVVLRPEQRRVHGWFTDAELRIPGGREPELFRLHARLSRTRGKPFLTRPLSPDTNTTRIGRTDASSAGFAAHLNVDAPRRELGASLWAGAAHTWVAPELRNTVTPPDLASRLAAGLALRLGARLDLATELLMSLEDGSLRLTPSLTLQLGDGLSLSAESPLFLGAVDSQLGQFGANSHVRVGLELRF